MTRFNITIKAAAVISIAIAALSACAPRAPQVSLTDRCAAEGFDYGTSEMTDCVRQKQQTVAMFLGQMQHQQEMQQQNSQQQMQLYQRPIYQNPTTTCSSNRIGNIISTTCN